MYQYSITKKSDMSITVIYYATMYVSDCTVYVIYPAIGLGLFFVIINGLK
jgi:hypothetical protein